MLDAIEAKSIKVLKENVVIENGLIKRYPKATSHKVRLSDLAP